MTTKRERAVEDELKANFSTPPTASCTQLATECLHLLSSTMNCAILSEPSDPMLYHAMDLAVSRNGFVLLWQIQRKLKHQWFRVMAW